MGCLSNTKETGPDKKGIVQDVLSEQAPGGVCPPPPGGAAP